MKYIKRPVTKFEISILLCRIDEEQDEDRIIKRALNIGKILPVDSQKAQEEFFFEVIGWKKSKDTQRYSIKI
jgi:hypothetical protein